MSQSSSRRCIIVAEQRDHLDPDHSAYHYPIVPDQPTIDSNNCIVDSNQNFMGVLTYKLINYLRKHAD